MASMMRFTEYRVVPGSWKGSHVQPNTPGGQVPVVEDCRVANHGEEVAGAGQLVPAVQRWGCLTNAVQSSVSPRFD